MINYVFIPVNPALIVSSWNCCWIDPVLWIIVIIFGMWFISKMMKND